MPEQKNDNDQYNFGGKNNGSSRNKNTTESLRLGGLWKRFRKVEESLSEQLKVDSMSAVHQVTMNPEFLHLSNVCMRVIEKHHLVKGDARLAPQSGRRKDGSIKI